MDQQFDVFNRQATKQNTIPFEKQIFPPQTNLLSNLDLDKFKPMNPENSVLNDKENSGQKKAHFGSLFSLTKVRKPANTILNKIYKKMLSPDIMFSVHGEKFPAHKDILAASCQFFDNMFTSGMKEAQAKEIEINDMSSQAFKVMLGFIYYEEPELTEDLATELLKASDKYKLPELSDSCEDFLIGNLTENNFVKIVQVAESIDNIKLKDAVLDFMARNLETVRKREDLFDVSKSVLIDLLSKVKSK